MTSTFVDSNVLIDILGAAGTHRSWAVRRMTEQREKGRLVVNQIVFSELAAMLPLDKLSATLSAMQIEREPLLFEASWHAGIAHAYYRKSGGLRERTLPDFLIGAQASHHGHELLTRDPKRYRSYFPDLQIIGPDTHP